MMMLGNRYQFIKKKKGNRYHLFFFILFPSEEKVYIYKFESLTFTSMGLIYIVLNGTLMNINRNMVLCF